MPFFRKKSDKQSNSSTPTSPAPQIRGGSVKRTPSNRSQLSDDWPNGDIGSPPSLLEAGPSRGRPDTLLISDIDGDLGKSLQLDSPLRTSSRLSKTFQEILHDKDALPYFLQYMESKNVGHFIRFWLDAESFQAATWTRIRTQSLQSLSKSSVAKSSSPVSPGSEYRDKSKVSVQNSTSDTKNISVAKDLISADGDQTAVSDENEKPTSQKLSLNDAQVLPPISEHLPQKKSDTNNGTDLNLENSSATNCSPDCPDSGAKESASQQVNTSNQNAVKDRLSQLMTKASDETVKARSGSQEEKFKKSIERDAVNIYSKYISLDATKPISINEELRNSAISKMCGEDGYVDPKCFAECQDFVVATMETDYYPEFTISVYHCKHQIDVLTSGRVYLADILYNEAAMFYFMEFIEQESASDLLQFILATDNFQQHLQAMTGYDGIQAQTDAMVLYDKYFSLQATVPLGFNDKIRFEVESNICREEGPLPDCFAVPRNIALKSLDQKYFPQYLTSELYYKYLSEMVNTIQMAQDFPEKTRKRTESDGSSEHSGGSQSTGNESISMKNTLLASDTRHWKKVLHRFEDDFRIDPISLNPDSLWKRPAAGGMSLGKVDTLGQFVSEFEPEPDHEKKKSSGFFKKKREKEKEQEAMALRVAEMIISDVTSLTQSVGGFNDVTNTSTGSLLSNIPFGAQGKGSLSDVTNVTQESAINMGHKPLS